MQSRRNPGQSQAQLRHSLNMPEHSPANPKNCPSRGKRNQAQPSTTKRGQAQRSPSHNPTGMPQGMMMPPHPSMMASSNQALPPASTVGFMQQLDPNMLQRLIGQPPIDYWRMPGVYGGTSNSRAKKPIPGNPVTLRQMWNSRASTSIPGATSSMILWRS